MRVGDEQAETDPAGNYIVDSLDAGTYVLSARARRTWAACRSVVTVAANGAATGDLRLDPEGRITGTVTASGGQPLAGATVILPTPARTTTRSSRAPAAPSRSRGLSARRAPAPVHRRGLRHRPRARSPRPRASRRRSRSRWRPRAGSPGSPPPGANVYLRGDGHLPAGATADANGEFASTDLPAGTLRARRSTRR